jgi:streptogramin lyase
MTDPTTHDRLRDLLREAVADVPAVAPAPDCVVGRARRRARTTVAAGVVAVVAVASLAVPGIRAIVRPDLPVPAGRVVEEIPTGDPGPVSLDVTEDAVWTIRERSMGPQDGWASELVRIDRATGGRDVLPLGTDQGGRSLRVRSGFGAVWVLSSEGGTLHRLDPGADRLADVGIDGALAFDVGEGGVWIAFGDGVVGRLDPATNRLAFSHHVSDHASAIAVAPGAVWVADDFDGTLSRLDPGTGEVVATVPTGANIARDVVADRRGAWSVGCRSVDGSDDPRVLQGECRSELIFVDAETNEVAASTPLATPYPVEIVAAATFWIATAAVDVHGVWVAASPGACRFLIGVLGGPCDGDLLIRVAHGGAVLGKIDLSAGITDVASLDGELWIADGENGRVLRYEPEAR